MSRSIGTYLFYNILGGNERVWYSSSTYDASAASTLKELKKRAISGYLSYKTRILTRALYPIGPERIFSSFNGGDRL